MKITFIISNDLSRYDGHLIRLLGLINSLAKRNNSITLIMNIGDESKIDKKVKIKSINYNFGLQKKRLLQFLVAYKITFLISIIFRRYFNLLLPLIATNESDLYIFPEPLDNAIGFCVSKWFPSLNTCIDNFGIISDEFKNRGGYTVSQKIVYFFKSKVAVKYEKTIFEYPKRIIFTSDAMRLYFEDKYPFIISKKIYLVSDSWSSELMDTSISVSELDSIRELYGDDFFFLFSGEFKQISGVDDLLSAFFTVCEKISGVKLLLIGDGVLESSVSNQIKMSPYKSRVIRIKRVRFQELKLLIKFSHVLVSPEKKNLLSDLILHIKYFNYLIFNKPIICPKNKAIIKFNKDNLYSVTFQPESIKDLADKMIDTYENYEAMCKKYASNSDFAKKISYENNTMSIDCND